ncbi:MAG: 4-(cytidine 5'-diphospho)-2-C-methyl-D-erythritol kinase [Pseudomonadota bacterium]
MQGVTLRAAGKLNLFLHITGRRADGYHLLESLVVFTTLADVLRITPSPALSLSVSGEFSGAAGAGEGNLVLKAAQALRAHTGCSAGAALALEKNIPVGAGLGGGSADAAAALRGLNDFWQLGLSMTALQALAIPLGADVAMCLAATPTLARGIGEQLTPLAHPLPPLHAVLIHTRTPLLTKDVYAAFTPESSWVAWESQPWASALQFTDALRGTRNHLQRAAIAVDAQVAQVLLALETVQPAPQLVRMTGSGACCLALYADAGHAARAARGLAQTHPNWWVQAVGIGG